MTLFTIEGIEKEIKEIFYSYIKINSQTFTKKERDVEIFLLDYFSKIDYFRSHPDYYGVYKIENDPFNRSVCWGLVKGAGDDTVVLIHHNDVVNIEDYSDLRSFAFLPDKLEEELMNRKINLSDEVKKDLERGDFIFGRGSADMKGGGAVQLALLRRYSQINNFKGNILLLSLPDEENLSAGMRSAVLLMNKLKEKYNLNYLITINSEPHQRVDKNVGVISEGSVGKMMVFVYVRGCLSHAGKVYEGLNSLNILAEIVRRTELSLEFSDFVAGEGSPPPTWLYLKDKKNQYDVSMPLSSYGCFSVLTLDSQPDEILEKVKVVSKKAFEDVIFKANKSYKAFMERTNRKYHPLPWQAKVITFDELYDKAYQKNGKVFKDILESEFNKIRKDINSGETNMIEANFKIVDKTFNYVSDFSPAVVVGFIPPYYPSVSNINMKVINNEVKNLTDHIIKFIQDEFKQTYRREYFYTGISDLSYTSIQNSIIIEDTLRKTMPLYGELYSIPLDSIERISMPSINLGPWGKDFHKVTERVLREDLYYKTPRIIHFAISKLLKWTD